MGHMSPQKTFEEGAMAYQPVISIQRNGTFNISLIPQHYYKIFFLST